MFTFGQAISRLESGATSCFKPGSTPAQKLQRLNEVIERFYEFGTWRGVHEEIAVTSSGGIITLNAAYQRIDGLRNTQSGDRYDIKPIQWLYGGGGPAVGDVTLYGLIVAIDLGDNGTGQRRYQLTGETATLDAMTLKAQARKRYRWVSDTTIAVQPDSFQALRQGVLALAMEDEADDAGCKALFASALSVLNGNLEEFEPAERQVSVSMNAGMGSAPFVH